MKNVAPPLLIRHLQRIDFLDENLFEDNFERLLKFLPPPQIATNTKEMDDLRAGYLQIKALQHLAGQYNPRVQKRLQSTHMMLVFPDLQQTLVIPLNKEKLFVGWHDHHTLHKPDIDLRQYDAIDKGVSRQHALFSVVAKRLQVMDLGSRHGTRVNGIPLPIEQPIDLKNMTIIHFAELEVILFLKDSALKQ